MEARFALYDPAIVWDESHYPETLDLGGVSITAMPASSSFFGAGLSLLRSSTRTRMTS